MQCGDLHNYTYTVKQVTNWVKRQVKVWKDSFHYYGFLQSSLYSALVFPFRSCYMCRNGTTHLQDEGKNLIWTNNLIKISLQYTNYRSISIFLPIYPIHIAVYNNKLSKYGFSYGKVVNKSMMFQIVKSVPHNYQVDIWECVFEQKLFTCCKWVSICFSVVSIKWCHTIWSQKFWGLFKN